MKIKCKVCDKIMGYNGKDSPMLVEEAWRKVVSYYHLNEYEIKASNSFMLHYEKDPNDVWREEDHLFICKDCMKKVFKGDIPNKYILDCPYNND
jgi:hypothetical protein